MTTRSGETMPALNFTAEFAALIENGEKTQTIRQVHKKRPIKEGDILHLYTGMRGPKCRKLQTVICRKVRQFAIDENGQFWLSAMPISARDSFAELDGFRSEEFRGAEDKMLEFFRKQYGLPFYGVLIRW